MKSVAIRLIAIMFSMKAYELIGYLNKDIAFYIEQIRYLIDLFDELHRDLANRISYISSHIVDKAEWYRKHVINLAFGNTTSYDYYIKSPIKFDQVYTFDHIDTAYIVLIYCAACNKSCLVRSEISIRTRLNDIVCYLNYCKPCILKYQYLISNKAITLYKLAY
jgi:hypothetical protein